METPASHTFLLLLFLASSGVKGLSVASLGCLYLREEYSIRCQNTSLLNIARSFHILATVVTDQPNTITVDYCDTPTFTPVFDPLRAPVELVQIRNSWVQEVNPDTFSPFASSLRVLDLSHNRLTTVPSAVRGLRLLEVLDLRYNIIMAVEPGSALSTLPRLRELHLQYNAVGGDGRNELGLSTFHLGTATTSLQVLSLRGNGLASLPFQLHNVTFPQLRQLDLSENVITQLPELSSVMLPKLQTFDLHDNRIQRVSFYSLPFMLVHLNLSGNPLECDCSALWLQEWKATNMTRIQLPRCKGPPDLQNVTLEEVPWKSMCPDSNASFSFAYANRTFQQHEVTRMASTATTITVSWRVNLQQHETRGWHVVFRKATDSPYKMTLSTSPLHVTPSNITNKDREAILTEEIINLAPSTTYIVCIAVVQDGKFTVEPEKCHKIRTETSPPVEQRRWASDSTTAASRGGATTIIDGVVTHRDSITIRWRLVLQTPDSLASVFHRPQWLVRIRQFATANFTDIATVGVSEETEEDGVFEYKVNGLTPGTAYDVCLVTLDAEEDTDGETDMICRETATLNKREAPLTDIAISVTVILAVVVLVILCCIKTSPRWTQRLVKRLTMERRMKNAPANTTATTKIPGSNWELKASTPPVAQEFNKPSVATVESLSSQCLQTINPYQDSLTAVTIYKSGISEC